MSKTRDANSYYFNTSLSGDDLLISDVLVAPHEMSAVDGDLPSGLSLDDYPETLGCALPVPGIPATSGTPLPQLDWFTPIIVTNRANGKSLEVELIDYSAAWDSVLAREGRVISLTPEAIKLLELDTTGDNSRVDFIIQNVSTSPKDIQDEASLLSSVTLLSSSITGSDIIALAKDHIGEKYVNKEAEYWNKNYRGPWDCADFVSYCTYWASNRKIKAGFIDPNVPERQLVAWSHTWWDTYVSNPHLQIKTLREALTIPGCVLLRRPPSKKSMGHVALSNGAGKTIEARGRKFGVGEFQATGRVWDGFMYIPGVSYAGLSLEFTSTEEVFEIFSSRNIPDSVIDAAKFTQKEYKIPASITIAQWALESGWGAHMPKDSNNPFGIKARTGEPYVSAKTIEFINGRRVTIIAKFRKFSSLREAFEAHGSLIAKSSRYRRAMSTVGDPDAFARALSGIYATDPNYGESLISLMKSYKLYDYN